MSLFARKAKTKNVSSTTTSTINEKSVALSNAPENTADKPVKKQRKFKEQSEKRQKKNSGFNLTAAPRSTKDCLWYTRMIEDGVCEVIPNKIYSKTMKFSDVNYRDASKEVKRSIFDAYADAVNAAAANTSMQITIHTKKLDMATLERKMFYALQGDSYDIYRTDINNILADRVRFGQSEYLREKYVTFSVVDEDEQTALRSLGQMENTLSSKWRTIGCETSILTGAQRMELMYSMIQPDAPFDFDYRSIFFSDLDTKDYLAPSSFSFAPRSSFAFGDYVGCILYAKEMDRNLTDQVLDKLSFLQMELVTTLHLRTIDQAEALNQVELKIAFMDQEMVNASRKATQQGYNPDLSMSYEYKHKYEEAVGFLNDLQALDQKMVKTTLLVFTYARTEEELQANIKAICSTGRSVKVTFQPLDYRQEAGFNSTLPIGRNYVEIERTMTTTSASILIPFTNQELMQPGGVCYGVNSNSGNLILFDRTTMMSSNGVILGVTGGGKSVSAKMEMVNVLLRDPDAQVFVIDPEREYAALTKALGGSYIHIFPGSEEHLNPMDITASYGDTLEPVELKCSFIASLCSTLLHGQLSAQQRSLIDRACSQSYYPYFASGGKKPVPTLKDFYATLRTFPEPEAQDIALALEMYIEGSLSTFAYPTNVDTDARITVYDIRDLGSELRTLGMLVVMDQIWNRLTRNKDDRKHTYIYIDEIQLLLSNEYSSNYFFELWSRCRKYGGICTGITQNVSTLLNTLDGQRMLSNSQFVLALKQSAADRDSLAQLLGFSPEQAERLTSAETGQGLLCAGGAGGVIVPFTNRIPTDSELYKLITTKLDEQMIV